MSIWFVTGVSTGLGRAISEAVLANGNIVVGTVRTEKDLRAFDALAPGRAHGAILDVTHQAAIAPLVNRVEREIGAIGVLINNAGYGHEGLIEESSLGDIRRQFDVNVFGVIAMIQAVLPAMRARRSGRIINITSIGGLTTFPGLGVYHASKFALEAVSETLGQEVREFGIRVTAVEPGNFRTDWAGRSMVRSPRAFADYDGLMNPISEAILAHSGRQAGDPQKAGRAILKLVQSDDPPAHLLLGSDAWRLAHSKLDALSSDFSQWKAVTLSTDFDT